MRQFIVENKQIRDGLIQLEGKDYRYLRQVLRVRAGDMISVRLPDGSLNNATVAKIDEAGRRITLQLCAGTGETITRGVQAAELSGVTGADGSDASGMGGVEYWLFQFLPRPQKFEQIVRQATECGVSVIVPVTGEYTEKSSAEALLGSKKERLERIIKEARQQSGSPVDTKVLEPVSLDKAIEMWKDGSDSADLIINRNIPVHNGCDDVFVGTIDIDNPAGFSKLLLCIIYLIFVRAGTYVCRQSQLYIFSGSCIPPPECFALSQLCAVALNSPLS